MGIKKFKPTTPSRRWMSGIDFSELTKKEPEKSLLRPLKKTGGRNCYGRITTRHIGGGHKRMLRVVDFKRDILDTPAKVIAIEYDPNRSGWIALVEYPNKEKRYILSPVGLKVGEQVISSNQKEIEIKTGNCFLLRYIPSGTLIHNIELMKGQGGQIVRGAGTQATILAKEGGFAQVKLPSGELRKISEEAWATIGQLGNIDMKLRKLKKAGDNIRRGIRPTVRGVAQNPHSHPHGGGEGRSGIGMPGPKTPWGKPARGKKTRRKVKYSDKFIVRRKNSVLVIN